MNKKERNEYMREYQKNPEHKKRHRELCRKNQKLYYKRHKSKILNYQKDYKIKYRKKRREKLLKVFGDKCSICGSNHNIHLHEIYGKNHSYSLTYVLNHKEDFIPLCYYCHRAWHHILRANPKLWIEKLTQHLNRTS
jgi:predicted HNH restriction endonuclease